MKGQILPGPDGELHGYPVEGEKNHKNNQETLFLFQKQWSGVCPSLVYSAHSLEGQGPSVLPSPSFRWKNPASCTTRSHGFLPHVQLKTRPRSYKLIRPAGNRHKAERNPSSQETQLWSTRAYMELCPMCGKVVPIHIPADKRNGNEEKQGCQKAFAQVPHASAQYLFFPFSCICFMLHRIFTLRAETEQPCWQPGALPQQWSCDCKHGQTLLLPVTKSWVPPLGNSSCTSAVDQAQTLPEQLLPLQQAPENPISCPPYKGRTTPH